MAHLLALMMLAQPLGGGGSYGLLESLHSPGLQLHLSDNIKQSFGNTSAAPDYWGFYDSANTAFRFVTTDSNAGGGTDATIWWADDGAPYFLIGNLAQSVRFDPSTNSRLTLTDESAATIDLYIGSEIQLVGSGGTPYVQSGTVGDAFSVLSLGTNSTTNTGALNLYSGNNTNGTSGNTGNVSIYSGASTSGTAGNIVFAIDGAPGVGTTALTLPGATGNTVVGVQLVIPDGTNADPAIVFADDDDGSGTGIYSASANSIDFTTNGSQRAYIRDAGFTLQSGLALNVYNGTIVDSQDSIVEVNDSLKVNENLNVVGSLDVALPIADLAVGSCTANDISFDNGGATVELCFCKSTNVWYCVAVDDTTGPAD